MNDLPSNTKWHLEHITPELIQAAGLRRVIYEGRSRYQDVALLETGPFGLSLVLDGRTQSSEADEFVYHESLVQPVMVAHRNPQRIFIAGGGEGATAREVLRHKSVTEVVMVDLDEEVVRLCKEHLSGHHQGAFDDSRLRLYHRDALVFLEETVQSFDVIIIDVPDPLEGGPAYKLFTREFYQLLSSRLAPGGLMVAQAGPAGPINYGEVYTAIFKTIASVFSNSFGYQTFMPSFGTAWGFVAGGAQKISPLNKMSSEEIDAEIDSRVIGSLRHYDGVAHLGMFALPKYLRDGFASEERLITLEDPIYAN